MATTTMAMTGPVPVPEREKVYSIFFTKYNGMTLLWRVTFIAWKIIIYDLLQLIEAVKFLEWKTK